MTRYQVRAASGRDLGTFEGDTPEAAIASMLLSRGITSANLIAANVEGVRAIPLTVLQARALERYADTSAAAHDAAGHHARALDLARQAGTVRGHAFALAERG